MASPRKGPTSPAQWERHQIPDQRNRELAEAQSTTRSGDERRAPRCCINTSHSTDQNRRLHMAIIPKAVTVTKNLTDAPMAVVKLSGAGMHDDPIITLASKIEKINSLTEVEKIIKELSESTGCEFFILGGAVVRGQELFATAKSEFQKYKNFREYIEEVHGKR